MADITFSDWSAQKRECTDQVAQRLIEQFKITFDGQLYENVATPLGIHWCLGPEVESSENLGLDGHTKLGFTLPPLPYPRRMWAGGEIQIFDLFKLNDDIKKISLVTDIQHKTGSSGPLYFLTITHDFYSNQTKILTETQRLVFKEDQNSTSDKIADKQIKSASTLPNQVVIHKAIYRTDPVLLFRYSALTFNGHRIHYDVNHATKIEGQPGIVVHGPMQATWLLNAAASHLGKVPKRFMYRNFSPLIAGEEAHLWVEETPDKNELIVYCCNENRKITMQAEVYL